MLRNRLQHVDSHNLRRVGAALDELARRVGFRVIPGLGERVIYRELFPKGLTLLDLAATGRSRHGPHHRPPGIARDDRRAWHSRRRASEQSAIAERARLNRRSRRYNGSAMTHRFNPTILREYDIRGIVGDTLGRGRRLCARPHLRRARARAKAPSGSRSGATAAPIRRCSRTALVEGLTDGGIDVVRIGMGPSPMLYFATHHLDVDGGIQVTGSHNPADYNGFKMLLGGRSVFGAEIQDARPPRRRRRLERGQGHGRATPMSPTPMSTGWSRISRAARSASAGTPAMAPPARCSSGWSQRLPGEHHTIFTEVDGSFPNHHPDPTVEANLADLKALVADQRARFRDRVRRRRRPHRRGRRPGPGDLGRPVAADPRRAGARGRARRDDHRRRQGQPGPVRPRSPRWAASR